MSTTVQKLTIVALIALTLYNGVAAQTCSRGCESCFGGSSETKPTCTACLKTKFTAPNQCSASPAPGNCLLYNPENDCSVCKYGFVLDRPTKTCVKATITNCIVGETDTTISKKPSIRRLLSKEVTGVAELCGACLGGFPSLDNTYCEEIIPGKGPIPDCDWGGRSISRRQIYCLRCRNGLLADATQTACVRPKKQILGCLALGDKEDECSTCNYYDNWYHRTPVTCGRL